MQINQVRQRIIDQMLNSDQYRELLKIISWIDNFGFLFISCSPLQSQELINHITNDVTTKKTAQLNCNIDFHDWYKKLKQLRDQGINLVFVSGIEQAIYDYEAEYFNGSSERLFYSYKSCPSILGYLNFFRENFRDDIQICLIFLIREFIIKYFIHRAGDIFDWRSDLTEFPLNIPECEIKPILNDISPEHQTNFKLRTNEIKIMVSRVKNNQPIKIYDSFLHYQLATLLFLSKHYEPGIAHYETALKYQPSYTEAWYNMGVSLYHLGRLEESLLAFQKAQSLQPDCSIISNSLTINLIHLDIPSHIDSSSPPPNLIKLTQSS